MRIVKRKQIVCTLLALLLVSLMAGCGPAPTPTATPVPGELTATPVAETPTATPVPEEPIPTPAPVTLTLPGDDWGYPSPFTRYPRGPGYIQMSFLFDTLTWKDEKGVIPWLADDWEASEDGAKWTFRLHEGVKWHDGKPFTAEDVVFTFEYLQENMAPWFEALKEQIEKVEVKDEHTVMLYLKQPIADFLIEVAGAVPIIPKHIWQDVEDPAKFTAEEAVIGTGPFKLVEYSKEECRYIYEANAEFFKGKPVVDRLVYTKVSDAALALKTGTVDAATFWSKEIEAVKKLEAEPNLEVIEGPSFWVLQLIFNCERPPFDKVEFRRAIAHAVDRSKIVEQVTHGGAIVANLGIVSPGTDWYNPELPVYEYDSAKAKGILDELGVEEFSLTLLTTGGFAREAELVKADLEQAGIEVEVKSADRSTVDGLLREGNFDLAISGHGGIADPSTLDTPTWPALVYEKEELDRLFEEQGRSLDEEERRGLVLKLQEIVAGELPILTLYHPKMWCVYDPAKLDTWFYTKGGVAGGIPIPQNKLIFLER